MADTQLVCLDDYEKFARKTLTKPIFDFIAGGAGDEVTCAANRSSFNRYKILPRVLRDVSRRDLQTTILGHRVSVPIGIAPTGLHALVHHDGELATASAAEKMEIPYSMALYASTTMEVMADKRPNCFRFLQLYFPAERTREVVADLVRRAEKSAFSAIVLTVDVPVQGHRYGNMRNNFDIPPNVLANINKSYDNIGVSGMTSYKDMQPVASLTWRDVTWLKTITDLPLVIKGIISARDAVLACEHGVAAVWVSNHGGRCLDTIPATIDVLEGVVAAVAGRCEVYMDGGVRSGTDVYKALALGARAVFIGRPVFYGLTHDGENGVQQVIEILKQELSCTMALSGCAAVSDIKRETLIHERNLIHKL